MIEPNLTSPNTFIPDLISQKSIKPKVPNLKLNKENEIMQQIHLTSLGEVKFKDLINTTSTGSLQYSEEEICSLLEYRFVIYPTIL